MERLIRKIMKLNPPWLTTVDLLLFPLFFITCFSFGYATLNRFDPNALYFLSDYSLIANIIEQGLTKEVFENQLTTRVLVPYVAHLIYANTPELGSWNMTSFALLVTSSTFTSLTAVLIYNFSKILSNDTGKSVLASFLFMSNFFTVNYTLITTVDSAYIFFLTCYLMALYSRRWVACIPIMVIGCLSKEAFLPVASSLAFGFILYNYLHKKKDVYILSIQTVALTSGLLTLLVLDYVLKMTFTLPWDNLLTIAEYNYDSRGIPNYSEVLIHFLRIICTIGPLLILALLGLSKLPSQLIMASYCSSAMVIVLGSIIGVAGLDYARFIFSAIAPVFCYLAASTIIDIVNHADLSVNDNEQ